MIVLPGTFYISFCAMEILINLKKKSSPSYFIKFAITTSVYCGFFERKILFSVLITDEALWQFYLKRMEGRDN